MFHIQLCIEVDAVGNPDEYVAVSNSVILAHAHADAITARFNLRQNTW